MKPHSPVATLGSNAVTLNPFRGEGSAFAFAAPGAPRAVLARGVFEFTLPGSAHCLCFVRARLQSCRKHAQ